MNRQGIHEALDLLITSAECEAARERDRAIAERDQTIAERDALRERLEALDETIAMVEMPSIPRTASGNKDRRQGRPVRTVVDPSPVIGSPESRPENWNKLTAEDIERALLTHPKVLAEMRRAVESLRKPPAAVESDVRHKGLIAKVQDLVRAMRNWSYCGDALVDDPAIYVPLDALTDALGMPRTPPVKERAPVEPVKILKAGPVRPGSVRSNARLPGTPEQDPADPLRIEYVESIKFTYRSDAEVYVTIETDETDGGTRRLNGHCYHSALVITAKELLDMACWTYEAEAKNTAARVRREVTNSVGEKRYADGFNAGYDQGLADARKEMRDAQEGDDR